MLSRINDTGLASSSVDLIVRVSLTLLVLIVILALAFGEVLVPVAVCGCFALLALIFIAVCMVPPYPSSPPLESPKVIPNQGIEEARTTFISLYERLEPERSEKHTREELSRMDRELYSAQKDYRRNKKCLEQERSDEVAARLTTCAQRIEALHRQLTRARAWLKEMELKEGSTLSSAQDPGKIFDELCAHPHVTGVQVQGTELRIDLRTTYIYWKGSWYEIGDFRLLCDLEIISVKTECRRATCLNFYHPYGSGGKVCFGNAVYELQTFLRRWALVSVVDLAVRIMTLPNPDNMDQYWKPHLSPL